MGMFAAGLVAAEAVEVLVRIKTTASAIALCRDVRAAPAGVRRGGIWLQARSDPPA